LRGNPLGCTRIAAFLQGFDLPYSIGITVIGHAERDFPKQSIAQWSDAVRFVATSSAKAIP
jgi:hypothetical protein